MSYHYKESGLDNIYLENGYAIHKTPYGKGVSIHDTEGLHKTIGRWLIDTPHPLDGRTLRFIRREMELTQGALASLIGATEQTLRLWEKHRAKAIPGSADRLLRAIYAEYLGGDESVSALVARLVELDQQEIRKIRLVEDEDRGWKVQNAA
ncbi:MAG: helix-turn-helix domain-containing protein [Parvibaculaceae bacterium]